MRLVSEGSFYSHNISVGHGRINFVGDFIVFYLFMYYLFIALCT